VPGESKEKMGTQGVQKGDDGQHSAKVQGRTPAYGEESNPSKGGDTRGH